MPRKSSNKPWLHSGSGFWCTWLNGKREYLDKDYKVACRKLRALKADQKRQAEGNHEWMNVPFAILVDEYLDDVKARRKEDTYDSCRYRLLRALKILGKTVLVGDMRKLHLAKIEQKLADDYSPTTVKDTLASVQGVFNWAIEHEMLDTNPLAKYRKPAARRRHRVIEPAEFQALLRHADVNFRRVLLALRMTGCRPGEIRSLIWEWVDLENHMWIFPDHKTITRQQQPRPRLVPLPDAIWKMCAMLAREPHDPSEHVFLNRRGQPYTKDCLVRKMARIRKRAGITTKAGENIVLYSNRHTYATAAVGKVSDTELAEVLGHVDTSMLQRYTHINADRLRDIQRRAQG